MNLSQILKIFAMTVAAVLVNCSQETFKASPQQESGDDEVETPSKTKTKAPSKKKKIVDDDLPEEINDDPAPVAQVSNSPAPVIPIVKYKVTWAGVAAPTSTFNALTSYKIKAAPEGSTAFVDIDSIAITDPAFKVAAPEMTIATDNPALKAFVGKKTCFQVMAVNRAGASVPSANFCLDL